MWSARLLVAVSAMVVLVSPSAFAGTLRVPDDFDTLQEAVDASRFRGNSFPTSDLN